MSVFVIYQNENGAYVSSTSDPTKVANAAILSARGYSVATLPDGSGGIWNPVTHVFDPGLAQPVYLSAGDLLSLFTPTELVKIYNAAALPAPASPQMFQLLKQLENQSGPINAAGSAQSGAVQLVQLVRQLGFYDDQNGVPGAATARVAAIRAAAQAGVPQ